jgi:hypothetical protein
MKKIKFICVQPRTLYYAWQVEVMINNFLKHQIDPKSIHILIACNGKTVNFANEDVESWNRLSNKYIDVNFYFYEDTRKFPIHYASSVRPNLLKQHFKSNKDLENDIIFYHDCDMLFTKKPELDKFIKTDIWYLSDTSSYINYNYIMSKGKDVYDKMCEIVNINPIIPKLMNSNSGGAQYIMKNLDSDYWEKVESDSEKLFFHISELNKIKKLENYNYNSLQIWCADMWAVLWNAWIRGYETKIDKYLDFTWSVDTVSKWDQRLIYHNAGITEKDSNFFFKAKFSNSLPYDIEDNFNKDIANYNYFLEVQETGKKSILK